MLIFFIVCHGIYYFIRNNLTFNCLNQIENFALLVSAICHDIDHSGRTNAFEIAKQSKFAKKYNDESVFIIIFLHFNFIYFFFALF